MPHDVSVIGFDDVPEASTVGLTTMRQDGGAKGRAAALALLDPESGPPPAAQHPTLAIRQSVR